ncbi:MAG: UvrD-helicase domain-containing protein [Thermoplasmata archaeon]
MNCDNLTDKQKEIIDYAGREDISAFAVAGSGKTSVLVCSYLKLIESMNLPVDESVSRILVITFTDDAATEIRGRIRNALMEKYGYIGPLNYISTIHSFANDLLQHHSIDLGIDPGYTVGEDYLIADLMERAYTESKRYMDRDELDLLDEYLSVLDLGRRELELRMVVFTIYWKMRAAGWSYGETIDHLRELKNKIRDKENGERIVNSLIKIFSRFYEITEERKRMTGILSYDDILYYANLILEDKEIRESYAKRFEYVIVDEYQDTSLIQQYIIEKISRKGRRIIAGDYFQSIYEWRDATPILTIDFIRRNGFRVMEMDENFRSVPEIVDFVNTVFSRIFSRDIKDIQYIGIRAMESSLDGAGPFVITVEGDSIDGMRHDEAEKIATIIENLVSNYMVREKDGKIRKIKYGDIAILFRKRYGMKIYAKVLQERGIRYSFIERGSFFRSEEISTIMNVLISLRDGTWNDIHNGNTFEILRYVYGMDINEFLKESGRNIETFREHMAILDSMKDGRKDRLIMEFLRLTGYDLRILGKEDGLQRYLNIYKLVDIAREKEENGIMGLDEFLDLLENMGENEDISSIPLFDPLDDSVRLMTIHSSKGLEFPVVFVADLSSRLNYRTGNIIVDRDSGIFLDIEELADEDIIEKIRERMRERDYRENMRVLYVAFTRAKQYLFLGLPESPGEGESFASKIMETLGEDYLKKYRERVNIFLSGNVKKGVEVERKRFTLKEIERGMRDPIFLSVSDIKNYHFCPRYMEISRLKLFLSGEYGTSFHEFMEGVDFENPPEGDFSSILDNFLKTPLGSLLRNNMEKVKREFPFHVKFGNVIIRGRIDLLYISDEIIVLDYKTGRESEGDRIQMLIYSYAIRKIFGSIPDRCILYYTEDNSMREFRFSEDDLKNLEILLERIVNDLRYGIYGKNEMNCNVCPARGICLSMEKQN